MKTKFNIKIINKDYYKSVKWYNNLPSFDRFGSAILNLVACNEITIMPGEKKGVYTGIAIDMESVCISETMYTIGLILPDKILGDQGLVLPFGVDFLNSNSKEEIVIDVVNKTQDKSCTIYPGNKVARMIFVPVIRNFGWNVVEEFK